MISNRAKAACKYLLDALEYIEDETSSNAGEIMRVLNRTYGKQGKTFWGKMQEKMEVVLKEAYWQLPYTLNGSIINWAIQKMAGNALVMGTFAEVIADPKWAQERGYIQIPDDNEGHLMIYKALTGEVVIRRD